MNNLDYWQKVLIKVYCFNLMIYNMFKVYISIILNNFFYQSVGYDTPKCCIIIITMSSVPFLLGMPIMFFVVVLARDTTSTLFIKDSNCLKPHFSCSVNIIILFYIVYGRLSEMKHILKCPSLSAYSKNI